MKRVLLSLTALFVVTAKAANVQPAAPSYWSQFKTGCLSVSSKAWSYVPSKETVMASLPSMQNVKDACWNNRTNKEFAIAGGVAVVAALGYGFYKRAQLMTPKVEAASTEAAAPAQVSANPEDEAQKAAVEQYNKDLALTEAVLQNAKQAKAAKKARAARAKAEKQAQTPAKSSWLPTMKKAAVVSLGTSVLGGLSYLGYLGYNKYSAAPVTK